MADRQEGCLTEDMAGICLWTVKESYLKMKGTGITVEPRLVEALPEGEEFLFRVTCGGPLETGWALTRWHEGVPVSLCMRNRPPEPAIRVLMPEDCLRT
jgi:phosphopantetheinyl transferase